MPAKQDIISMIDQLPEQQMQKIMNYIMLLKNEKKHKERGKALIAHIKGKSASGMSTDEITRLTRADSVKKRDKSRKYDFSDLAGKLEWKGDAVAEQRRLRDEW